MTARWHHRWRRASERVRCLSLVPRGRQECVCRASPSLPSPIPSALSMNSISNTLTPTRRTLTAHSLPPCSLRSNCSRASHETSPPSDSQSGWAAPLVPRPAEEEEECDTGRRCYRSHFHCGSCSFVPTISNVIHSRRNYGADFPRSRYFTFERQSETFPVFGSWK